MTRTLLLTGAGGAALPGLIRHLRAKGFRVLAADMDPHAVGLYLADAGFVIPGGLSATFVPAIRKIVRSEKVDVLLPLVDEELLASFALEDDGVKVILPRREFIATCLDKHALMKELAASGIPVPATRLASEGRAGLGFPIIAKPRTGRGSRGVEILETEPELDGYLAKLGSLESVILQELIEGPEFTVSVVVWRDGEVQAVVPKEIISKRGITRLAVTRRVASIEKLCVDIQRALRADGPFNVQLRLRGSGGPPLPFEINPRFSTSVSLTLAAGVDEVGSLIEQSLGSSTARYELRRSWKENEVLVRTTLDQFMSEAEFRSRPVSSP